jgi:hypothetical protein
VDDLRSTVLAGDAEGSNSNPAPTWGAQLPWELPGAGWRDEHQPPRDTLPTNSGTDDVGEGTECASSNASPESTVLPERDSASKIIACLRKGDDGDPLMAAMTRRSLPRCYRGDRR